jgi:hypothetical protein
MISFLIPFRDDGIRLPAHEWLLARWEAEWPDAEFIVEPGDDLIPFSKTVAVNACAARSHGEILVILDADTWAAPHIIDTGVQIAASGGWALPDYIYRLNQTATSQLLTQPPTTPWPEFTVDDTDWAGHVTGAIHILPRHAFDTVGGMDPRFRGWGGEDHAFSLALDTLHQHRTVLANRIYHLYHPRPLNPAGVHGWPGQTHRNNPLNYRYIQALNDPTAMRSLLAEAHAS